MDFLNRAYAQLLHRYRAMTPGSRLMLVLMSAVVLASAGYLGTHQGGVANEDLMQGVTISPNQLPQMQAAFETAGLKGFEVRNGAIYVPRGQTAAYMAALVKAKALPRNFGDALREAIDSSKFYESARLSEGRLQVALQETLAQMICSMPGIEQACVIYGVDTKPGFNREKIHTAVANVKPTGSTQLDEARVKTIRSLLVGSFPGLKPEDVTVLDLNGRAWDGKSEEGRGDAEDRFLSLKRSYEQDLKNKTLSVLSFIPNVTVVPSVVLACEQSPPVKQNDQPASDHPAASRVRETPENCPTSDALQPNTATSILGALLGDSRVADHRTEPEPREPAKREDVRMAIASARVLIGVPMSYFKSLWQEQNPPMPGQPPRMPDQASLDQIRVVESMKIQHLAAQLLPQTDGAAAATDLVAVTTFQDVPATVASPAATDALGQEAIRWLRQSWPTAGLVGLVLFGLLAMRWTIRGKAASLTEHSPETESVDELPHEPHAVIPPPHARRFHQATPTVHRDISEFVEEDPDTAAHVLRNWIGHAG